MVANRARVLVFLQEGAAASHAVAIALAGAMAARRTDQMETHESTIHGDLPTSRTLSQSQAGGEVWMSVHEVGQRVVGEGTSRT
jgi:hypothetical protein